MSPVAEVPCSGYAKSARTSWKRSHFFKRAIPCDTPVPVPVHCRSAMNQQPCRDMAPGADIQAKWVPGGMSRKPQTPDASCASEEFVGSAASAGSVECWLMVPTNVSQPTWAPGGRSRKTNASPFWDSLERPECACDLVPDTPGWRLIGSRVPGPDTTALRPLAKGIDTCEDMAMRGDGWQPVALDSMHCENGSPNVQKHT